MIEYQPAWFWEYVGMPFKQCGRCHRFFRTGQDEWVDLSGLRKTQFCFQNCVLAVISGVLSGLFTVKGIRKFFAGGHHDQEIGIGVGSLVVLIVVAVGISTIRESLARTNRRNSVPKK